MKRGALVGCGFFAQNHLHAWGMIEGADIVAVCDVDESRAKAYAEKFGIAKAYVDAEMMLETETPDFVDVATQPHTHLELTQLAAGHGVNIICQKPLAPSLEEAKRIVEACQNVTFMVHENFRWQRPMLELKRAAAKLGDLFFGRVHFRSAYDVYANQPYLATDERFILYDLGVHLFDLARFFFGEADTLTCHTQRVNPDYRRRRRRYRPVKDAQRRARGGGYELRLDGSSTRFFRRRSWSSRAQKGRQNSISITD